MAAHRRSMGRNVISTQGEHRVHVGITATALLKETLLFHLAIDDISRIGVSQL